MLKFIGKFRDLIPMGYTFQKLYATNYRTYRKEGILTSQKLYAMNYRTYRKEGILIWVRYREVMVDDLNRINSARVAKLILDGAYPIYPEDVWFDKQLFFGKGRPRACMLDEQTGKIVPYVDFMKAVGYTSNFDHDRYKELSLYKEHLDAIKELHERDMIVIV